jgi:hypothetical protein
MTESLRTDVDAVGDTVRVVSDGVREAVTRAQRRLQRLDALMQVAQDEAEDFVVSSAATLRGLRFGAGVLRRSFLFARRNGAKRVKKRRRFREPSRSVGAATDEERPRIKSRAYGKP